MDILDSLIDEFYELKNEQKHRRIDYRGPDSVFYAQATELAVEARLLKIRSLIADATNPTHGPDKG